MKTDRKVDTTPKLKVTKIGKHLQIEESPEIKTNPKLKMIKIKVNQKKNNAQKWRWPQKLRGP